jgi:hypothetical protein
VSIPAPEHLRYAARADALVKTIEVAAGTHMLNQQQVAIASGELNRYHAEIATVMNEVGNDPRLFSLKYGRVLGNFDSLKTFNAFASLQDSLKHIDLAMKRIAIIWDKVQPQ